MCGSVFLLSWETLLQSGGKLVVPNVSVYLLLGADSFRKAGRQFTAVLSISILRNAGRPTGAVPDPQGSASFCGLETTPRRIVVLSSADVEVSQYFGAKVISNASSECVL